MNVIIDCDPGVDDTAAIALSLFDEGVDIRLITTVCGNLDIETVTRNAIHVLEKFGRTDIPVAKGASRAMKRISPDASFIHQKSGMGGYNPPEKVETKPIELDAVEAMYQTICKYKNDICIIELAPQTNLGTLIKTHPDVVGMVNRIYTEGCSPYGWKTEGKWENYCSFNASSDPEALEIVINSGIPITIVPSRMGRELANFNEQQVADLKNINDVGRFLNEMYSGYWEHNYEDKRIATNDTCACLALKYPEMFTTKKATFYVDTDQKPGKTTINLDEENGWIDFVVDVNREMLHEKFFEAVKSLDRFKFYDNEKQ